MATTGYELVKESIFKEANEVSERLGKEPSNPKLLGAWEALTSVMKASALFDEYNDLRKNNSDLSWDEIERKYPEDRSEMSEEREMLFVDRDDLEHKIAETINGKECRITTCVGGADGILEVKNGELYIKSDKLDSYLEEYSME